MMKKCYCPSCGIVNNIKNKKCMKCDAKLKPYDEYLVKLLYNQVEGDIRGGIVSSILAFLKAHTYGVLFSITLLATVIPNIVIASKQDHIVDTKPEILLINQCVSKKFNQNYSYVYETQEKCNEEGYNAFNEVSENINPEVFTFGCDEIIDDCGKTWYGVSYNIYDSVEEQIKKVYY